VTGLAPAVGASLGSQRIFLPDRFRAGRARSIFLFFFLGKKFSFQISFDPVVEIVQAFVKAHFFRALHFGFNSRPRLQGQ
jgi:hypothetical protein